MYFEKIYFKRVHGRGKSHLICFCHPVKNYSWRLHHVQNILKSVGGGKELCKAPFLGCLQPSWYVVGQVYRSCDVRYNTGKCCQGSRKLQGGQNRAGPHPRRVQEVVSELSLKKGCGFTGRAAGSKIGWKKGVAKQGRGRGSRLIHS